MAKNKVGRPTRYRPEFCQLAEALLSCDQPMVAVARQLHTHVQTIDKWRKKFPEFDEACKRGRDAGAAVFLEKVQNAAWNPLTAPVNNTMVSLLAVNCYKLVTNRSESKDDVTVDGNLSLAEAVRRRHEQLKD